MAVFTSTNVLTLILIGTAGLVVFSHSAGSGSRPQQHAASAAVDALLGLILILFGIRAALKPSVSEEQQEGDHRRGLQPARYAMLGVVMMLSNFTTLALFLPADKDIAISHASDSARALAFVVLVVLATVTAWLPLLMTSVFPATAAAVLGSINRFTTGYSRQIRAIICFGFGTYLLYKGLSDPHPKLSG